MVEPVFLLNITADTVLNNPLLSILPQKSTLENTTQ